MTACRGIEWCSLHSFLSYACSSPNSSGLVRNDLALTNLQSGSYISFVTYDPQLYM